MKGQSPRQSKSQLMRALAGWEEKFRAEAQADDYLLFRTLLRRLELPDEPTLMLDGTIMLIQTSSAYLAMDNRKVEDFLSWQQYAPVKVSRKPYQVVFDIHGMAYARIKLPATLQPLDLADLYGAPWDKLKICGYCDFWISRINGTSLTRKEIAAFEKVVESDLRFDYTEDELAFWFDPDSHEGILKVSVQDVFPDAQFVCR